MAKLIEAGGEKAENQESLADLCAGEPTKFVKDLLEHPGDKNGDLRKATEVMIDGVVGLPFLNGIEDPEVIKQITDMAGEFRDASDTSSIDPKVLKEKMGQRGAIRQRFQKLIDSM